jgi:hypothetical protein
MTPEEIAREIVNKWYGEQSAEWMHKRALLPMGDFNPLKDAIATALAASEQRVRELEQENDTLRRQYQQDGELIRAIKADCESAGTLSRKAQIEAGDLKAKLQASEQRHQIDMDLLEDMRVELQHHIDKSEASERALERVRGYAAHKLGCQHYTSSPLVMSGGVKSPGNCTCGLTAAFASPGSPTS